MRIFPDLNSIPVFLIPILLTCVHPGNVDPEFIYGNHFNSPREMVHDLIGHGYYFQGGDVWIRFRSNEDVSPAQFEYYSESPVQPAVEYFLNAFEELETMEVFTRGDFAEDYAGFQRPEAFTSYTYRVAAHGTNRVHHYWFLRNRETGLYYFRSWTDG